MRADLSDGSATVADRVHLVARGLAMIAAAFPSTVLVPLPLTQLTTRRFAREDRLKRLHRMVEWASFCAEHILRIRLDVDGLEHLPRPSRGHMYVSNHQSYTDILVLMKVLDTVAFLSKRVPVSLIPLIGRSAYCGGTVYLDRSSPQDRERALGEVLEMCERSTAVVVFPEGTRSSDGSLRAKIYPRSMQAAHERGLRLVPVGIHGTHRVIPKAMDRVRLGQPVAVRVGPALDPRAFASPELYAEACWAEVARLHEAARAALRDRAPAATAPDLSPEPAVETRSASRDREPRARI